MEGLEIHKTYTNTVTIVSINSSIDDVLEKECKRLILSEQKIDISEFQAQFTTLPYFLRLFLSLYFSLSKKLASRGQQDRLRQLIINPLSVTITIKLARFIVQIIQKKLFFCREPNKCFEEISYSIFYKEQLFPLLVTLASETSNFLNMERLANVFRDFNCVNFQFNLPIQIYNLFGGGVFTIEVRRFRERLIELFSALSHALSTSESIVTRNIDDFRKNRERIIIMEDSIKVVLLAKNKENLQSISLGISADLFRGRDYLQKQQFLGVITGRHLPILAVALGLLRAEAILIQERSFRANVQSREQSARTNFYATEMAKILNKCPFNGDQRCSCKKCQCVRRNRESAKLSQQKKRNAVEQLQPLRERLGELETANASLQKKNKELEEENMMLRELLSQMKENPVFQGLLRETIEPVSKILNNEL